MKYRMEKQYENQWNQKVGSLKRSTKLANFQQDGLWKKERRQNYLSQNWKWGHYYQFYKNKKKRLWEYYEKLYVNKVDHLDEMDKFLETQIMKKEKIWIDL